MARSKADGPGRMVRVADGIYRRGDTKTGVLIARVWDPGKNGKGGKVNITVSIPDHADYKAAVAAAKDKRRAEEDRIKARGHNGNGATTTVAEWAERWQDRVPRNRGESTRRHNQERVKAFVHDFGDRPLREVAEQRTACQLWVRGGPALDEEAELARGWRGVKTEADGALVVPGHRGNLGAVRAMFTDAMSIGLCDSNPFARMGLTQARRRNERMQALTAEEVRRLKEIAGAEHGVFGKYVFAPMIDIAAWTGLRPGELFGLWPEDVDLDGHRIRVVRQMNAKTRELSYTKTEGRDDVPVPLLPEAEEAFRMLEVEQLPRSQPIFRTTHGKPYTQRNHHYYWDPVRRAFARSLPETHWLSQRIARAGDRKRAEGKVATGVEGNLDFYELRHFFGSQLAARGVSPYDIAKAMGHSDSGKTAMEYYIHTDAEDAADRVLQAFGRAA